MKYIKDIQQQLETIYGTHTGLDVLDFVRSTVNFPGLGEMLVEHNSKSNDLDIALLFDRDIFAACGQAPFENNSRCDIPLNRALSVSFEEVSHFVYLSFNHNRGRNITNLELEIQSEVDRILLAFHGPLKIEQKIQDDLISELFNKPYSTEISDRYETARQTASQFIRLVGADPKAWTKVEFDCLRNFFHNDLSGKIHLSRDSR